ncbi:flagellar basal body-associated FliL family protein [Thalassotalea sp. G20_0]|uniref:flagellar basal body-associated FliL family protein n=1 Tax=Thalassotalea sp. G20_0 TaxID=2821093 RepID=UPI001ADC530D|nr:flagellar basal body-associated FliL family protein [Thalassotalea sp. G20_0]MBO9495292.1 flagellar basal body-associated FliL family protein [Thalassotalea sp. G20_0]
MNMKTDDDNRTNIACAQWPEVQRGQVNLIALVLTGVVTLAIVGGAAFWFFFSEDDNLPPPVPTADLPVSAQYLSFKDMVVNLVNDETYDLHYMQLSVSVMTRKRKCFEQMKNNQPVILNALQEQLSSWTFQDVMIPEQRELLRKKLLNAVHLRTGLSLIKGVEDVFITNMVIQ